MQSSTDTRRWYIAIVGSNTERATAERLGDEYETLVVSQQVVSVWRDGRRKMRDRILIRGKVLVRCTEQERLQMLAQHASVKRFMVDLAGRPNEFGRRPVAVVPDGQVERLRFLLHQNDAQVSIDNEGLRPGEKVRVLRGPLCGLEGEVAEWTSTQSRIYINIEHVGCACVDVSVDDIERI